MPRILIVDEDIRYIKFLKHLFELNGLSAHGAESADEALLNIREREFDMIITEYMMYPKNGVELALELRNVVPAMPIVVLTSAPTRKLSSLAKEAGITTVIDKSISHNELVRTVKDEYAKSQINA